MNEIDIALILDALDHDGATYTMEDGRTLTLVIEHDPDTSINDYDCYGETERYSHRYVNGESRTPRPDGFDGNAEKIQTDRGSWIWWQPPRGEMAGPKRGTPEFATFRSLVIDLLQDGFKQVGIRVDHECDECHHSHEADAAWVGGVDSTDNGYLRELVSDLLHEVGIFDGAA